MLVESLHITDVKRITPRRFGDHRGFFSETWNERALTEAGIVARFVQDNQSCSAVAGTVRALHLQLPPHEQGKLVRVTKGAILDVAVDVRAGSASYGQHVTATLSAENWAQLWVPPGFAHGFCTLEPDTEVIYKVTEYWVQSAERGILWNDPAIGIDWPVTAAAAILSDKDKVAPLLAELGAVFGSG